MSRPLKPDAPVKRGPPALTFTLDMVIRVVTLSLGVGATVITATAGIRSDVRDILTRMEAQEKERITEARIVEERFKVMTTQMNTTLAPLNETVNEHKRLIALLQYEVNALKPGGRR
jgi:hypothetical protein